MKNGGSWIFLSHSSHDIKKVRMVRNEFERYGQNPLAFHLKCLNTDTPEGRAELDNLIKREIDAREWFVFCESPDAHKSKYVQLETDYIIKTGKKKIWSLDMTAPIEKILEQVRKICTDISVFISYSQKDSAFAYQLEDALIAKDFSVWSTRDLSCGGNFFEEMQNAMERAAKHGFYIAIIGEGSNSSMQEHELEAIIESDAKLIPILLGDAARPAVLKNATCYALPATPREEDVHLVAELIEEELKSGIKGPIRYQADLLNKLAEIQTKLNYKKRYHRDEPVLIHTCGATDDYCEVYRFPCCGKTIMVGDGPVSRFRADGCCEEDGEN